MNNLVKNFSFYTISNILPKILSFFLLPIYTNYLHPSEYGIVNSMEVLTNLLVVFFTLSIERSLYRLYYDFSTEKEKKDFLGTISLTIFLVSIVTLILLFVFSSSVEKLFKNISFNPYFIFVIITSFILANTTVPRIVLQIQEKAKKYLYLSVLQMIINLIFVLYFVIFCNEGASGILKALLISNIILTPFYLLEVKKFIHITLNIKILIRSLNFSLPILPVLLSSWILNLSDRIFIERYFTTSEVGIYSLAYKIASLVLILATSFETALNPFFYKLANNDPNGSNKDKLKLIFSNYVNLLIVISVLIFFFSKEVFLLFDSNYYLAYNYVTFISLALFLSISGGVFNLMIYQEKKTKYIMFSTIISASLSLLLNIILVPKYGIWGAVSSAIFSYFFNFVFKFFYAKKCYYLPINWMSKFVVFFSAIFLITFLNSISGLNILILLAIKIFIIFGILLFVVFYRRDVILTFFNAFRS